MTLWCNGDLSLVGYEQNPMPSKVLAKYQTFQKISIQIVHLYNERKCCIHSEAISLKQRDIWNYILLQPVFSSMKEKQNSDNITDIRNYNIFTLLSAVSEYSNISAFVVCFIFNIYSFWRKRTFCNKHDIIYYQWKIYVLCKIQ